MKLWGAIAALTGIEVERLLARVRKDSVWIGLVAVFLLTAFVAFLVAADLALATLLGPIYAALVIGGIALILALLAYLAMSISRMRRRRQEEERKRQSEAAAALTSAAVTGLPVLLKSPLLRKFGIPAAVLAAIVLAGFGDRRDE